MTYRDYSDYTPVYVLQKRLKKAKEFTSNGNKVYCKYLYMDASKEYFNETIKNGLIESQTIDDQRDIDSPLSRKYGGIPFCATVRYGSTDGQLIPFSPFGPKRLLIPVGLLVNSSTDRLYLADYYDVKGQVNHNHYLILIVVKFGSGVCTDHFLELSLTDNDFFSYDQIHRQFFVVSCDKFYVRIHYTESLDIRELLENRTENGVELIDVETTGKASFYSKSDLRKLSNKALEFSSFSLKVPCKYLYRNKSKEYFDDILNNNNGIMRQYPKGSGGDPRCPFHAGRMGLFFSASVSFGSRDGKPIPFSPYGPRRLQIPVGLLIDGTKDRLYFADFYCLQGSVNGHHCVSLVVTKAGRTGCRDDLRELSLTDNDFFSYDETKKEFFVRVSEKFFIEIFYVDSVDVRKMLNQGALMVDVETVGRGHSVGIPKKKSCVKCNIDD